MPNADKSKSLQPRPPPDRYVSELLAKISEGKRVLNVLKGETIFSQGDSADAIYFVESGRIKVSVVSSGGKEGVLGLLGPHSFFGEGSLVGQMIRLHSASVVEPASLFQVEKRAMLRALRDQPELSEKFTAVLLSRTMDLQEDLCDQLFNDSEKRLARVLIKISSMDNLNPAGANIAALSHETLAEMVGTTRSRVTHFMNKFRKLGLIEYKDHLTVKTERLTEVVLNDDAESGKTFPPVNTEDTALTEFLDDYFMESEEHLVSIRRHLLVLEGFVNRDRMDSDVPAVLDELLGALHSIKGLSAMVGVHDVERIAHAMEDSIRNMKKAGTAPAEDAMESLVAGTELIGQILAARRLQASATDVNAVLSRLPKDQLPQIPATESVETLESVLPAAPPTSGVRIDMKRLDHLMTMVGDLVISRGQVDETLRRLADVLPVSAWRELQEANFLLQRQLRNLREGVMRIRMVPIGNIFERMRFLIRGLEHESHKDVRLELTGENTEIDKLFVEKMMDPLMHMVRNAISHGLEPPEERIASGKTEEGHLRIRARTEAETVVIELEDDGRGVDIEQITNRARAMGLLEPDDNIDGARVLQMICAPGFSTREQADFCAGHGVGMTLVKSTINGLGGTLAMETRLGKGTRFTIRLPLTLVIMESLIVYVNDQPFAVPRSLIQEVLRVETHTVTALEGNDVIPYRGAGLPVVYLHRLFRMEEKARTSFHVVVVDVDSSAVGIAIDRIAKQREIVARPIEDALVRVPGIAGATELGDGRPVLILDVAAIVDAMRRHQDLMPELVA